MTKELKKTKTIVFDGCSGLNAWKGYERLRHKKSRRQNKTEEINGLPENQFCLLDNFRYYLSLYGLSLPDSLLGGMLGLWGFFFTRNNSINDEVINGRNGDFCAIFDRFQNLLTPSLTNKKIVLTKNNHEPFLRELSKHKTCIVWVDNFFINYSVYYKKTHYKSPLILKKVNPQTASVYDNGEKNILLEDFLLALIKDGKTFNIYYNPTSFLTWKSGKRLSIREGLSYILENMKAKNGLNGAFTGITGMYIFSEELEKCTNQDVLFNYYYQLNRPDGLAVCRSKIAEMLQLLKDKYNISVITAEKIQDYQNLSHEWRLIANLLFKLSVSYCEDLKQRVISRIHNIIRIEEDGLKELATLKEEL